MMAESLSSWTTREIPLLFNFDIEKVHISMWSSFLWSFLNVPFISNFICLFYSLFFVYSLFPSFKTSPFRDMIHFFGLWKYDKFFFLILFFSFKNTSLI